MNTQDYLEKRKSELSNQEEAYRFSLILSKTLDLPEFKDVSILQAHLRETSRTNENSPYIDTLQHIIDTLEALEASESFKKLHIERFELSGHSDGIEFCQDNVNEIQTIHERLALEERLSNSPSVLPPGTSPRIYKKGFVAELEDFLAIIGNEDG